MATENAKIKIRNRTLEIKFVAQYCDHILDKFINEHTTHDLKFQEIVNILKKAEFIHERGSIWRAHGVKSGIKYVVILIAISKFAVIKTCYRYGW